MHFFYIYLFIYLFIFYLFIYLFIIFWGEGGRGGEEQGTWYMSLMVNLFRPPQSNVFTCNIFFSREVGVLLEKSTANQF